MRELKEIGREPGQPILVAGGPAPELGSGREALPLLEGVTEQPRPIWRHPAFVVSTIFAILALLTTGVLAVIALTGN
ncbi:MAG: hypothetical protein ACTIJ6_06495 [Leucobacter sp.]